MRLNIAHKIFGVAVVVLILMAAVAVYSVLLTAKISAELDLVATKQLPLSHTIGEVNVRILEQGILLQRLFQLDQEAPEARARVDHLKKEINAEFERAYAYLASEAESAHAPAAVAGLAQSLRKVEAAYRTYEEEGLALLDLHATGNDHAFHQKVPDFNDLQNTVDAEIGALRRLTETIAEGAVVRADESEKRLLRFNAGMTLLAAVLGSGIAALVTFVLVRNVRNLVNATERVEDGDLEVEVRVSTQDEVGRLGQSFNHMVDGLRLKERIKDTFGKYVDPRIVDRLIDDEEFTKFGGERREMTIMFIDLQGYTSISERLAPDALVDMLNLFLGRMTDAVSAHNGVINDFQGDAVMAFWGAPFTGADEHAVLACRTALAARDNFAQFKADVATKLGAVADGLDLEMRVGVSTGEVVVGNIGAPSSRKFSVIGDPVNLGARLEGANKNYGTRIILSERTRVLAGDTLAAREIDLVRVKGKAEPIRIFELLPASGARADLAAALAAYRAQEWPKAEAAFAAHRDADPDDPVPVVFLSRVAQFRAQPPGGGWDGVWEFQSK